MKRTVLLIGAFDRFNLGDLLFPAVVRATLAGLGLEAEYCLCSLTDADLSGRGGGVTHSLSAVTPVAGGRAVVCGGEVLAARWLDARLGLITPRRALALKLLARVIGAGALDSASRRGLVASRPLPWVLGPGDIGPDSRVAYAAVGGCGLARMPADLVAEVRQRLGEAAHLSVRDQTTAETLHAWKLEAALAPDSAALVARCFPADEVARSCGPQVAASARRLAPYALVQAGRYPSWGLVAALATALERLHAATGLGLLLAPLGQASGHDDHVPLARIARRLRHLPVELLDQPGVTDILACIAGARLVIGTSLHANLTALAYGVPRIAFGRRVAKLDAFVRAWDPLQSQGCADVEQIPERAELALAADPAELCETARNVAGAARDNLQRLLEDIL